MTKRIVSGIFILTALGALGIILAGALTSGEQLIVRFLTAVIVAALGLYVISDLRLQADDDAVSARTGGHPRMTAVDAPPNSTAAFMATVTRRGEQKADEVKVDQAALTDAQAADSAVPQQQRVGATTSSMAEPASGTVEDAESIGDLDGAAENLSRPGAPDTVRATSLNPPPDIAMTELFGADDEAINGSDSESDLKGDQTKAADAPKEAGTQAEEAVVSSSQEETAEPETFETAASEHTEEIDAFLAQAAEDSEDDVTKPMQLASVGEPATVGAWASLGGPSTNGSSGNGSSRNGSTHNGLSNNGSSLNISHGNSHSNSNTNGSTFDRLVGDSLSEDPNGSGSSDTTDSGNDESASEPKSVTEFEYSDELQSPEYDWPAPPTKPVDQRPQLHPFEKASAAYQAEKERLAAAENGTSQLPVHINNGLEPSDYADAPLAPIIDLRDLNGQTAGSIDVAISAGEVEVIATLIEQGMLSTEGPISDRDVRTMVYVAFTSNELRKLLLAGGSPEGPNHGLDLGPVELFDEKIHTPAPKTLYAGRPEQHQPQSQIG